MPDTCHTLESEEVALWFTLRLKSGYIFECPDDLPSKKSTWHNWIFSMTQDIQKAKRFNRGAVKSAYEFLGGTVDMVWTDKAAVPSPDSNL